MGGRKVAAAHISRTINLAWFNSPMTSSLHHNDVITVKNFEILQKFYQLKRKSLETFLNHKKERELPF